MKYFIIAGEASGDQHGARLMKALIEKDSKAEFSYLGGQAMESVDGKAIIHIRELAFMGFTQVLVRLNRIKAFFSITRKAIRDFDPDILILIDYAGFNLRIARWASKNHYRVSYYIAPKVWAWNPGRIKLLRKYLDHVYVILPFEEKYFTDRGVSCTYVGNPVADTIRQHHLDIKSPDQTREASIALLPGSRRQEIIHMLPVMMSLVQQFPQYRFKIAAMHIHSSLYQRYIPDAGQVDLVYDSPVQVLKEATAALVTSGTATLETALCRIPQLVLYKTNAVSYLIAKSLIRVPFISLVNLILQKRAVPEFIQAECNTNRLVAALERILPDGDQRDAQLENYDEMVEIIGSISAADNLAALIIKSLSARQ